MIGSVFGQIKLYGAACSNSMDLTTKTMEKVVTTGK